MIGREKMTINIYTDNTNLNKHYQEALKEYEKRSSIYTKINILKYKENAINKSDYIILVNASFDSISSTELADKIKQITTYKNSTISFVVNVDYLDHFDDSFSISKVSLSSEFVTLILAEQIYRAFTIITGKKYHK